MILIVGLGNPGKKYEKTRHNIGFMIVESLKHALYRNEVSGVGLKVKSFSNWKSTKKFRSEISEREISGRKIILAKPQTFMNNSGKAVKLLTKPYTLDPNNLIVVHDDIDLPLGTIRIVKNRGAAGHKGVESIIKELKTKNFVRFRIGIRPQDKIRMGPFAYPSGARRAERGWAIRMQNFVLQKFNKEEGEIIDGIIQKAIQAIKEILKENLDKVMQKYNQ